MQNLTQVNTSLGIVTVLYHFHTISLAFLERKKKLLTSDIERAGVFALFFPSYFCFIKHRINFIKSVSIVELPADINMKNLQQQFASSLKLKSDAVYKIILTASLVIFTDGSILVLKIRNLGHFVVTYLLKVSSSRNATCYIPLLPIYFSGEYYQGITNVR